MVMASKKKGILSQMAVPKVAYSDFTTEKLQQALMELAISSPPKREFVMFTGERGFRVFDFHIKYGDSFVGRWWHEEYKYANKSVLWLSVGRKHSLYKVKVTPKGTGYSFDLYRGTKMISFYANITALNVRLGEINLISDVEDAEVEYKRAVKKALREREGKLLLIKQRYGKK